MASHHHNDKKQPVTGVLLLDKPMGLSSQQAVAKVKYLLKSPYHDSKKAGHTGTLDPMATGLLPICLGSATKFAGFGLSAQKSYTATIALGAMTDTGDKDGQIICRADTPVFSQSDLDDIASRFLGAQWQVPPMYSALKKDGKKLYELARMGIDVERKPRAIVIDELSLTKRDDHHIDVSVSCSKGTYVRVLGQDIAKSLGSVGHLIALRRVATGGLSVDRAISLDDFIALDFDERLKQLLPADSLLGAMPMLTLTMPHIERLLLGQRLNIKALGIDEPTFFASSPKCPISKANIPHVPIFPTSPRPNIPHESTQQDFKVTASEAMSAKQECLVRIYNTNQAFFGLAVLYLDGKLQPKAMGWF